MTTNRRGNDNCTLDKIEDMENLKEDCEKANKVNKHMQYIKADAVKRYNELEMDFLVDVEKDLTEDEIHLVNRVFRYLRSKC
jgi:hypothetical protein